MTTTDVGKSRKIEPQAGKKQWDETVSKRHSKSGKTPKKKGKKNQKDKKEKASKKEPYEVPKFQGLTMADAERQDKVYKARLSEIKYQEQSGQLVNVKEVQKQAFDAARRTRDAILSLPARLAHELAVETDPHQLEVKLSRELTKTLEHLTTEKKV